MQQSEKDRFIGMMDEVCDLMGRKSLSQGAVQLYFRLLEKFTLEEAARGLAAHMSDPRKGRYMPKPADIIAALAGDPEALASRAWAKVHAAVTRTGAYESVVFDDPVIHAVISDMGGWMDLCRCQLDDYRFREHAFLKRYKAYLMGDLGKYPRALAGEFEIANRANGHAVKPPVMIGNPHKALEVYESGSDAPRVAHTPFEQGENLLADMLPDWKALSARESEIEAGEIEQESIA